MSERRGRVRSPRRRGGRNSLRRWLAALGFVLLLLSTAAAGFWFWSRRPSQRGTAFTLTLRGDESVRELRDELSGAGALDHPLLFEAYLGLAGTRSRLKPGPHLLRPGLSPAELVARLTRSSARRRVKLTIPEGFNRFQIAERVEKLELASAALFLAETQDEARLHGLGVAAPTAEGYLFPATYELPVDSEPGQLAATLVQETKRRLERLLPLKAARLKEVWEQEGWGEREALTLASIVEKEAADRREHGSIASVFYNRLTDKTFRPRRMLQSDATAAYGCITARAEIESCRDYRGLVTPAMLRDATNPYNTYKHPGLPPGPIGNPSESAILSVLDPPQTPYFFFVAGTAKRHVFSRTFSEHERAIVTGMPASDAAAGN
jgi:UPF0755 protein